MYAVYNIKSVQQRITIVTLKRRKSLSKNRAKQITYLSFCLKELQCHGSEFVTNDEIRSRTGQPLLSNTVRSRRLFFFGHLHRTDPSQDHHRALQACILGPPDDWRRRIGRPRQSWLRTVEADLRQMNLGLATSKPRAQDRSAWRKLGNWQRLRLRQAPEEREKE